MYNAIKVAVLLKKNMTRKHFILIASILKRHFEAVDKGWDYNIFEAFADLCESEHPQFDRDKFYKACGFVRE